ncbi:MAG: low molecular weight phosphotyrosine protein phosphatase, partial [Bacteroidales bacterium]|nr:low molecular weight phosphotyrosine protein phosphatase [Bacteroidales bacterium]
MNILFVCLGNICRSPMAQGILRKMYAELKLEGVVDSAGFESYHINDPPDDRAIETALAHGIDLSKKRARLFSVEDFDRYDKIY